MKVELSVQGMHCDGCVKRVANLLAKVEGVDAPEVSLGHASFEADDEACAEAARAALVKAGYAVEPSGASRATG
jgi:copper chaperone